MTTQAIPRTGGSTRRLRQMSYTTERALRAIELLAFGPCSAPELAVGLQIHPRTARRLLHKLVDEQYATATPRGHRAGALYDLSPKLIGLAAHAIGGLPLTTAANRMLAALHEQLDQPVFVATPSYRHVVVVHNHGAPPHRWEFLPARTSAPGKVLLAHRPAWRQAITARSTAATPTTAAQIERDAKCILERGFAIEAAERPRDHHAIAVAIPASGDQPPIAALTAIVAPGQEGIRRHARSPADRDRRTPPRAGADQPS
jgi:DNA-binding IclR family transcriptional regulator